MIKIIKYLNAIKAKLKDRRILVFDNKDHSVHITFVNRTNNLEPHAIHTVIRNKIVYTDINLSEEAAQALLILLNEHFRDTTFKSIHKDVL